jgi:hypothetical protein
MVRGWAAICILNLVFAVSNAVNAQDNTFLKSVGTCRNTDWALTYEDPLGVCPKGGRFLLVDTRGGGRLMLSNGARYDGEYRDGIPNGRGVAVLPNGERYQGEWRNGLPNGQGVYTWPNGNRYEGQYVDGLVIWN